MASENEIGKINSETMSRESSANEVFFDYSSNYSEVIMPGENKTGAAIEPEKQPEVHPEDEINDIEGSPYGRSTKADYTRKTTDVELDELPPSVKVGTEYVAKILGVTTQTIRNYVNEFGEFIQGLEVSENGYRSFNRNAIDQLREIIELKDKKRYTIEQVKAELKTPLDEREPITEKEKAQVLVNQFTEMFKDLMTSAFEEMGKKNQLLIEQINTKSLEDKSEVNDKLAEALAKIEENNEKINNQQNMIEELSKLVKESTQKPNNEELENLKVELEKVEKEKKELENKQAALEKENEELKIKKRPLFGFKKS